MKKLAKSIFFAATFTALLISCDAKNNKTDAEKNEEAKVGNVYDAGQQGTVHENRDNQFPSSRNDNKEGTGLETGAPSDTASVKKTN